MDFSLVLSSVALVATFYQAHLQRVHNQKSVKPLPQIDLEDRNGSIYVRVQNNGVGPMIVNHLIFTKGEQVYHRIQDAIDIDPKLYSHIDVSPSNKKVIVPGGFLVVFSEVFAAKEHQETIDIFRRQLAALHLQVKGCDIYNNHIVVEKSLQWFGRHGITSSPK